MPGIMQAVQVASGAMTSLSNLGAALSGGLGAGPPPVLALGNFIFSDFAIPETIKWGGKQSLVVHKLPGGARVIDAMGPDHAPIAWSGIFLGPGAAQQAQTLDAMRVSGQVWPLTWGNFSFDVLIEDFQATSHKAWHVTYQISCVVKPRNPPPPGLTGASAASSALGNALGAVGSAISGITSAAQGIVSTATGLLRQVESVVLPITNALGVSVPFLSQASMLLGNAQAAVGMLSGGAAALQSGAASVGYAAAATDSIGNTVGQAQQAASDAISDAAYSLSSGVSSAGDALASIGQSSGSEPVTPQALPAATAAAGETAASAVALDGTYQAQRNAEADASGQPSVADGGTRYIIPGSAQDLAQRAELAQSGYTPPSPYSGPPRNQ